MKNIFFLIITIFFISCSNHNEFSKKVFLIGFSQCTTGDSWRKFMNEEMHREMGLYPDYEVKLIIKDANNAGLAVAHKDYLPERLLS